MNILDENISVIQRQLLRSWKIPIRHIGYDAGRKGMTDEEIIPFLLTLRRPTFFTLDWDFYTQDVPCTILSGLLGRQAGRMRSLYSAAAGAP